MIYHCMPQHPIQHIFVNSNHAPQNSEFGLNPVFGIMEYETGGLDMEYETGGLLMEYE